MRELKKIIKKQKIAPKIDMTTGDAKGEFGITLQPEYPITNIMQGKSNDNPKGKMKRGKKVLDLKYIVLLEIQVTPGTGEYMETEYGRKQNGQMDTKDLPEHKSGEKEVVVFKLEQIKGTNSAEQNLNLIFMSSNPSNENDPVYQLNNRILKIKIVGGLTDQETVINDIN